MTTKTRQYMPALVALLSLVFVAALLAHEHYNGGVRSHHLLDRRDLPAISNWFGLALLPVLGWLLGVRLRRQTSSSSGKRPAITIGTGLVCALLYGAALAACFEHAALGLASGLFFGLLLLAAVLPVYRVEYIFGFVVGMTFTFGAVLPVLIAVVVAALSALLHFAYRAVWTAIRARPGRQRPADELIGPATTPLDSGLTVRGEKLR